MKMAPKHWTVTIPATVITIIGVFLDIFYFKSWFNMLSLFLAVVFICLIWFFRDPERKITKDEKILLSPADGLVFDIKRKKEETIVFIRMYIFDCHIIRIPCDGTIQNIQFKKGSYFPHIPIGKGLSTSTNRNARRIITIKNNTDEEIKVIEIAGTLAYRTVVYYPIGTNLKQGDRLGMIRFGSETDLHFPTNTYEVLIKEGSKVKAGISQIARRNLE